MTCNPSTRRSGTACPLILGVIAFVLGAGALFIALCRDPFASGFSLYNPFSDPLAKYEVDTPAGALTADKKIESNGDLRASAEFKRREAKRPQVKELMDSFKVSEEAPFTRDKDPKKDADKGSGECKILFVEFRSNGEPIKKFVVMEKNNDTGMWDEVSWKVPLSDIEKKDKDLAKKMRQWNTPEKGLAPDPK